MKEGAFFLQGSVDNILHSMEKKVWKCVVPKSEVPLFLGKYKVGNFKTVQQGVELRILSDEKPFEDAIGETTILEDAFLYYFGEKAGE